jgi:hypothetical protein
MTKHIGRVGALLLVVVGGCVSLGDDAVPMVSNNTFNTTPTPPVDTVVSHAPASDEVVKRVGDMGLKILARNPDIAMRPNFVTVGSDQPEIMHVGTSDIYVTEGLAKRCETDGQLAAVLCQEVAKMVVQREILTTPAARSTWHRPPPESPVGRDAGDMTRYVELAQYEKTHQRDSDPTPPPPNPDILARGYLEKTGYQLSDLDAAAPLLRQAEANGAIYRKIQAAQVTMPQSAPTQPEPRP